MVKSVNQFDETFSFKFFELGVGFGIREVGYLVTCLKFGNENDLPSGSIIVFE